MPRRAQNPNHPLTRLRRQLSTPDHVVTREELAQRTGIALGSVKALESGKYGLTNEIVLKISRAIPVNPGDLFRAADPLRDFTGRPLSAESKALEEVRAPYLSERSGFQTDQFVAKMIFEAAEQNSMAIQFRFLLREALTEAAKLLGIEALVSEELSKHMGEFDPSQVASQLRPDQGESAKRWKTFERLLQMEEDRLWMQKQDQEPVFRITPEMTDEEKQKLNWESLKFEADIRTQALANVAKKAANPL